MAIKTSLAASVQAKNGRLYAVIQYKENGKSKSAWRALGLPEGSSQSIINRSYREVVTKFETELAEKIAKGNRPAADIPVFDYLCAWLEKKKSSIQINTYTSYHGREFDTKGCRKIL